MSQRTYRARSSSDAAAATVAFVGKAVIFVIVIVIVTLYEGWATKTIWNWFIPAIFHGAPRLGIAQAVGLSLIPAIFMAAPTSNKKKNDSLAESILTQLIRVLMLLVIGAIVHDFI
jgi:hypothetical protein